MTQKKYLKLMQFFNQSPVLLHIIRFAAKQLAIIIAAVYAVILIMLVIWHDSRFIRCLIVPAAAFVFITVIRKLINRPRPYDTLDYDPLVSCVRGKAQSFPSRHTGSAWIIALTLCTLNLWLGIPVLIAALCISVGRVCTGMHYPSDVIAGFIVAVVAFFIGFFVL